MAVKEGEKNFPEPVSSMDSNGAKVFALLVVCHELLKLGGYNAIIEGDPFSTIQWGLVKSSFPWRLVDWVKEEQDISSQMNATDLIICCTKRMIPRMVLLRNEYLD